MSSDSPISSVWRDVLTAYIGQEAQPVEKFSHQPRLYHLTQRVGAGLAYDDDVVFAAAWLHDLGVFTGHRPEQIELLAHWDSKVYAMEKASELLERFGFPVQKTALVVEAIGTHQPADRPLSIEGSILRDADILEQLGATAVMRTVCKVGRDTRFSTFADARDSLRVALEALPPLLELNTSKMLATPRVTALKTFLCDLEAEALQYLS